MSDISVIHHIHIIPLYVGENRLLRNDCGDVGFHRLGTDPHHGTGNKEPLAVFKAKMHHNRACFIINGIILKIAFPFKGVKLPVGEANRGVIHCI